MDQYQHKYCGHICAICAIGKDRWPVFTGIYWYLLIGAYGANMAAMIDCLVRCRAWVLE